MAAEANAIKTIFLGALEKSARAERAAYLDEACAQNATLRQRVEALLEAHDRPDRLLDQPAAQHLPAEDDASALNFLEPSAKPGSLGRLGHYEVLQVIGRGGMGIVLRAFDEKLHRVVALKVLAAPLAASGTARQRFVREARAAAAVRDDHVVAIHAVCDDGPVPYLVMEFIDGQNLEALIRRGGPLEVKETLRIGIQVASGLAAAHKQGLVHRDVKTANILLENGVQRVKLTDFGLARATDDASLTQSGLIAGTPLYMSPEQAAGEPIDARADLFSLGSVLYELCTGRPAFRAPTTVAVIKRVCDEKPRPIREVNSDVPEPLCRVIERLHAKKPADRPASATEVADLLARMLAELQRGSAPESRTEFIPFATGQKRNELRSTRHWQWAAAALLLVCVGLGLAEATGVTNVRGTVVRLFSAEGTLVVEVDDPGVSVTVDGGEVIITGAGAKEIRLKPGNYKVAANKDGKVVRQELVTVTRNGRQVVRISTEAAPLSAADVWEKSVAALPAEQQVKAVVRRLKELNLAFDGTVTHKIENGAVRMLSFHADDVVDISPVRALKGLVILECRGSPFLIGKLADLTPLRGLSLTHLDASRTQVEDLGPLQGMPLQILILAYTRVADLAPLKGMRLETLTLNRAPIKDLSALRGLPLKWLDLYEASGVSDLSVLEGMPLEYLNLTALPVSDLSGLAGMNAMKVLILPDAPVTDLTPLKGMKLNVLNIQGTRVSDLSPLKGMPLEYLNLTALPVSDLSLLTGMKSLRRLILDSMPVTELKPLRGLGLNELSIRGMPAEDLSPLQGLPLRSLRLDYRADRKEFVRSFKKLEAINDKPAAEFWK